MLAVFFPTYELSKIHLFSNEGGHFKRELTCQFLVCEIRINETKEDGFHTSYFHTTLYSDMDISEHVQFEPL